MKEVHFMMKISWGCETNKRDKIPHECVDFSHKTESKVKILEFENNILIEYQAEISSPDQENYMNSKQKLYIKKRFISGTQ